MVNAKEFRLAFAAFLGEERFRKFVPCGSELRYWQEKALEKFLIEYPEFSLDEGELEKILRICPIYNEELERGVAEVFEGNLDYSPRYTKTRLEFFPWAGMDPVSTEGGSAEKESIGIFYCSSCRNERAKWVSENS